MHRRAPKKSPCSPPKRRAGRKACFLLWQNKKRDSNKEGADTVCGRKQSGGLFSPTWSRSKATRRCTGVHRKNPLALRQNEEQVARPAFCFGKTKRGIRTRREQTQSAEENSPVDCFCRRGQGAKRREGARECAEKIPCSPPKVHRNSIKITVDFFYARKPLEIRLSAVQTYNKPRRRAFLWRGFVRFTVVSAI